MAKKTPRRTRNRMLQLLDDDLLYTPTGNGGKYRSKVARMVHTGRGAARRDARTPRYEEWTREKLSQEAAKVGVGRHAEMSKRELIDALRNY